MALGALTAGVLAVAGVLIGATGIGGVLVVPVLVGLEGMDPARAVAASALAFACPGVLALWRAWQLTHTPVGPHAAAPPLWPLVAGALPGAVLGATWVHGLDTTWLLALLAVFVVGTGVRAWRPPPVDVARTLPMGAPLSGLLGLLVGLGSGLTGTGGPVLLVPVLLACRVPIAATVLAAQTVQLPIALSAGAAHLWVGRLDVPLALVLGMWLVLGAAGGQWLGARMPMRHLPRVVALLLVGTGLWMAWRVWGVWYG